MSSGGTREDPEEEGKPKSLARDEEGNGQEEVAKNNLTCGGEEGRWLLVEGTTEANGECREGTAFRHPFRAATAQPKMKWRMGRSQLVLQRDCRCDVRRRNGERRGGINKSAVKGADKKATFDARPGSRPSGLKPCSSSTAQKW